MDSILVFVGFVKTKRDIDIGVRLCDIVKRETSLIKMSSFVEGLKQGVEIVNVEYNKWGIHYYGGDWKYAIYDSKGSIIKNGKPLCYKLDGKCLIILSDGSVVDGREWLKSYGVKTEDSLNLAYSSLEQGESLYAICLPSKQKEIEKVEDKEKDKSDLDKLHELFGNGHIEILKKHLQLNSKSSTRGLVKDINFGENLFRYQKSTFIKCVNYINNEVKMKPSYCSFKIRTLLGTVITEEGRKNNLDNNILIIVSDSVYDGEDLEFKEIFINGNRHKDSFKLSDIIYVREPKKWYGNKELLEDNLEVKYRVKNKLSNNIEFIAYNYKTRSLTVVTNYYNNYNETLSLGYCKILLDIDNNFKDDKDNLASLISNTAFTPDRQIKQNKLLDLLSERGRDVNRNIDLSETYRLCDIDRKEKDMYMKLIEKAKDGVEVYVHNRGKLLVLYNGLRDSHIKNLYVNNDIECNMVYVKERTFDDQGDKNLIRGYNGVYTRLNRDKFESLLSKLEPRKVYKDLPLSEKDGSWTVRYNTPYTIVCEESKLQVVKDKSYFVIIFEGVTSRINHIQARYLGIEGSHSVAYLIYREVLKHDNTIPRCKEQLMCNGEIEDVLDKLVLDKEINEKEDIVRVYMCDTKIEMRLSEAKKQLLKIYEKNSDEKVKKLEKKLNIMQVVGNIRSVRGSIIVDESMNGRDINVPKDIDSLIIQGRDDIKLNNMSFTEDVKITSPGYNSLFVNNLDISGTAANIIQKARVIHARFMYKHCKIHNMNVSGRSLYDIILTMLWLNDIILKGKNLSADVKKISRSKEVLIIKMTPKESDISDLIQSVHRTYDMELSEKNIKDLISYVKKFEDEDNMKKATKTESNFHIGLYIMLLGALLSSYNVEMKYCEALSEMGNKIGRKGY